MAKPVEKRPVYVLRCVENGLDAALYSRIHDFYEKNRHEFNAERSPRELLNSLGNGSAIYVESNDGEIVAASLTTDHAGLMTEVGATRVLLNGFRLQRRMKWYQIVNDHLFAKPRKMYFAVIARGNAASLANIRRCGFSEVEIDADFLHDLGIVTDMNEVRGRIFLSFDTVKLPEICCKLIDLIDNPVVANNRTGDEIVLRVDGSLGRNSGLQQVIREICETKKW